MSFRAFNGDCLTIMKDLSANSIDCFICDLPYGCLAGQTRKTEKWTPSYAKEYSDSSGNKKHGCAWDIPLDLEEFWKQIRRLAKDEHTPVIHFCNTRFGYDLIKSNEKWFRYDLVWEKTNAVGFLSANKMPMRSHENIYVFSKAGAYYKRIDISGDFPAGGGGRSTANYLPIADIPNMSQKVDAGRRCVKSVITVANKKIKGGHPTQKPDELYKWLIERYCPPGGTILDPTAGSFSSCRAATKLGRNAIGIEKSEEYFNKFSKLK
jgi:DNA modification methylase